MGEEGRIERVREGRWVLVRICRVSRYRPRKLRHWRAGPYTAACCSCAPILRQPRWTWVWDSKCSTVEHLPSANFSTRLRPLLRSYKDLHAANAAPEAYPDEEAADRIDGCNSI